MFCPHCGNEIELRGNFCPLCGWDLTAYLTAPEPPEPEREPDEWSEPEPEAEPERPPGSRTKPASRKGRRGRGRRSKTGRRTRIAWATVVLFVVAVLVVVLVVLLTGRKSRTAPESALVYRSGDSYGLLFTADPEDDVFYDAAGGLGDVSALSQDGNPACFSPDGQYLYYFENFSDTTLSGTLYRARWREMSGDAADNDKQIEKIADNVRAGYQFLEDGTLLYLDAAGALCSYDGRESVRIASGVITFAADSAGNLVYAAGTTSADRTLYSVSVSDPYVKNTLIASYKSLYPLEDLDHIFYTRTDTDGSTALYVIGYDTPARKLASNVTVLQISGDVAYYTVENGVQVSLYKYVNDPFAGEDAGVTDPDPGDYATYEDYTRAAERVALRETLLDGANDLKLQSLYCYNAGTVTEISDSVIDAWCYDGTGTTGGQPVILYYDADRLTDFVSLDELTAAEGAAAVKQQFYYHLAGACFLAWGSAAPICPEGDLLAEAAASFDAFDFSVDLLYERTNYCIYDSVLYLSERIYEDLTDNQWYFLFASQITDQTAAPFAVGDTAEGSAILGAAEAGLYWAANLAPDAAGTLRGDLYCRSGGRDTLLAEDLPVAWLQCYGDGTVLAAAENGDGTVQLTLISSGTAAEIPGQVTQWQYLDGGTLLYRAEGGLYVWNGKTAELLRENVDWFWAPEGMTGTDLVF